MVELHLLEVQRQHEARGAEKHSRAVEAEDGHQEEAQRDVVVPRAFSH